MGRAAVSVLNTPTGRFPWYEDFPRELTAHLAAHGIAHEVAHKNHTANSTIDPADWRVIHGASLDSTRKRQPQGWRVTTD